MTWNNPRAPDKVSRDVQEQTDEIIFEWWLAAGHRMEEAGDQRDAETILLDMQQELNELIKIQLGARTESGDAVMSTEEMSRLGSLCLELQWRIWGYRGVHVL